jgi:hypothetical protein
MRDKVLFLLFTLLAAITVAPIAGGLAVGVGYLAGMRDDTLVILFGSATGGMFSAIMALAGLAASLFFGRAK